MNNDIYNINNYSNDNLFHILGLESDVNDYDLEVKIVTLINKYKEKKNEDETELFKFFNDVYKHFFEVEDEESSVPTHKKPDSIIEKMKNIFETTVKTTKNAIDNFFVDETQTNTENETIKEGLEGKDNPIITRQIEYSKSNLNPLLKQTIKRIISVDSQYRTNKQTLSTDFTFNLSEPLKDVVALRLYSVQIPYTWYTISSDYGSNFFYLKGSSPGINNGLWDYQVKIPSGNYNAPSLQTAINNSINDLSNTNTDINFGNTGINYNTSTNLMTLTVDLTLNFTETNYYLDFYDKDIPWTSPNEHTLPNLDPRYKSTIAAFLGYNYKQYNLSSIYTYRKFINDNDYNTKIYYLNSTNNFFTIYQYIPNLISTNITTDNSLNKFTGKIVSSYDPFSNIYDSTKQIIIKNTITVKLSGLPVNDINGITPSYSRYQIETEINNQLNLMSNSITAVFTNPYFKKVYITDPSLVDFTLNSQTYYYQLNLPLNRKNTNTNNDINIKSVVVFPDEIQTPTLSNPNIWVGENSCFKFKNKINELNDIISETQSLKTNYDLSFNPSIIFTCNTFPDISYCIYIPYPSYGTSYSLNTYLDAINTAILNKNTKTIDSSNPAGIFNPIISKAAVGTGFIDNYNNDYIDFNVIITKIYSNDSFYLDNGANSKGDKSMFYYDNFINKNNYDNYNYNIADYNIDLGLVNTFTIKMPQQPSLNFKNTNIINIYSKINRGLSLTSGKDSKATDLSFCVYGDETSTIGNNLQNYISVLQSQIRNYCDIDYNNGYKSYPLQNSSIIGYQSIEWDTANNKYSSFYYITLNLVIQKIVTHNDFSVSFYDINLNADETNIQSWKDTSWYKNLNINKQTYNLKNYNNNTNVSKILFSHPEYAIKTNTVNIDSNFNIYGNVENTSDISYNSSLQYYYLLQDKYKISGNTSIIQNNANNYAYAENSYIDVNGLSTSDPYIELHPNSNYFTVNLSDISGDKMDEYGNYKDPYTLNLSKDTKFYLRPIENGYLSSTDYIQFNIPKGTYTRNKLLITINNAFANNPITKGSYINTVTGTDDTDYIRIRLNINKIYKPVDYNLVYYDIYSFVKCFTGSNSVRNVTWDTTLGWILGFRHNTIYSLSNYSKIIGMSLENGIIKFNGDTVLTLNIYNYLLIILDDFTQSHLNDGLVTITNQESDTTLPSYNSLIGNFNCDLSSNTLYGYQRSPWTNNALTMNQIYASQQINSLQQQQINYENTYKYNKGPFIQDIFALVPVKASGLTNGSYYVEFGGTLQNQERLYFGPVNISRMSIKLINDRGNVIDLNGSNWSFSFICEQLYQQNSI